MPGVFLDTLGERKFDSTVSKLPEIHIHKSSLDLRFTYKTDANEPRKPQTFENYRIVLEFEKLYIVTMSMVISGSGIS